MKLSEVKTALSTAEGVNFLLPNNEYVPGHFHVTEVGLVSKHFIDCGGTERVEKVVNFQLWNANDHDHKLKPQKLLNIISLCERKLGFDTDLEVEVEYQNDTIGKYNLGFNGKDFMLLAKQTACLASDACGVPGLEITNKKAEAAACCSPGGGCC